MQDNFLHSFSDSDDSSECSSPKHAAPSRCPRASRGGSVAEQEAVLDARGMLRALLCVLLSVVLVFGLVPETSISEAFASDGEEASELVEAEEVDAKETGGTDETGEPDEADASEEADAGEEDSGAEDDAAVEDGAVGDDEADEGESSEVEEASDGSEEVSDDDEESADGDIDSEAEAEAESETVYDLDYVEGEIIIVYEDEALDLDEELDVDVDSEAVVELVGEDADEVTLEDVGVVEQEEVATTSDDEGKVVLAQLDEDVSVEEVIEAIEDDPDIAYVQPNYSYSLLETTSDPYLSDDTSSFYNQYYLFESGFTDAWDYVKVEGSVTIAVLDTGCNLEHEDLQDNLDVEHAYDVTTGTLLSKSKVSNNGDADGHGTQVCGIIAAYADNGLGIAGASFNATILPVKVFDSSGACTTVDVVAAYEYLAELIESGELDDLRVVNMSIGTYTSGTSTGDLLMEEAITDLLEDYGVLTVCAGGNGDGDDAYTAYCYPADFEVCVSVTAVDMDGANSSYSDYNDAKDISAYGEKILTTSANGGYVRSSGTSMAAPQVTAAVALIWAANPSLSASEVVAILQDTATEVTGNKHASSGSAGIIDVEAAVLLALQITGTGSSGGEGDSGVSFIELAGYLRYDTMAEVVLEAFDGESSTYAVVATGENYPDALAAASLAGALDAPIVLVGTSSYSISLAIDVLEELDVKKIYVVGGTSAVSASVVLRLQLGAGVSATRLYGDSRQETAVAIAEKVLSVEGSSRSKTAIVAAGANYPDALSISPYAYWSGSPIYLAEIDGSLSSDTLSAMEEGGYTSVIIVGGTSVVSSSAQTALKALGLSVTRLYGDDRYETSEAVASWCVKQGMSYDGCAVATGENFPDALVGSVLCGRTGSVLLLASDDSVAGAAALMSNASTISTVYFLGGTGAVPMDARDAVADALGVDYDEVIVG